MNDLALYRALVALTDFRDDLLDAVLDSLDEDDKLELIADLDKLRAAVDRLREPAFTLFPESTP